MTHRSTESISVRVLGGCSGCFTITAHSKGFSLHFTPDQVQPKTSEGKVKYSVTAGCAGVFGNRTQKQMLTEELQVLTKNKPLILAEKQQYYETMKKNMKNYDYYDNYERL